MKNQDFTTTIVVDQSPDQVFNALKNPQNWWSGEIEGKSSQVGDEIPCIDK